MLRNLTARWLPPEALFFMLVWLTFLSQFRERAFADPGTLWHTVVGDRILADGFMTTDPFTYTHSGRTWIPQQWGGEVAMAVAHRVAGLDTLLLGFATGVAAVATWVFRRLRVAGMHWVFAGALALGALFVASFHFFIRPHLATIAFLAVTVALLVEFDRGRASLGRLALLVPLFVAWTNVHGGVLGGVLSFGVAAAGWAVSYLVGRPGPIASVRGGLTVLAILVACALTPFVNPFGLEMIATWQRIVGSTVMKDVVNEHKPLDPAAAIDQLLIACGLVYCLLFAGVLPAARREFRATWLIPLVWMVLTVKGIRQGPLFVVTGAVVLADFWPYTVWQTLLRRHGDSLAYGEAQPLGVGTFALPTALVAAALALQAFGVPVPLAGCGWARPPVQYVPTDLTPAVAEELARHPGARLFNDCNLGGYLIYYHPGQEIFMDDRFELYGDDWLRHYVDAAWDRPERVEDYCDRYGCSHALVGVEEPSTPFDRHLSASPRWAEVARGRGAALFRRLPAASP